MTAKVRDVNLVTKAAGKDVIFKVDPNDELITSPDANSDRLTLVK